MLEETIVREDDVWSANLHNDTLMQCEYLDGHRSAQLPPEKRLMLAILQDAVACYQRNSGIQLGKRRQLFLEVESWIKDQESDSVFSFPNICDTLGINPDYLSRGLFREWEASEPVSGLRYLRLDTSSRRRSRRRRRRTAQAQAADSSCAVST